MYFILYTAVVAAAGAYLEHKFGSKLTPEITALQARLTALEASFKAKL
jgi:hypothetical protein